MTVQNAKMLKDVEKRIYVRQRKRAIRKRKRQNFIISLLIASVFVSCGAVVIDFFRFPDCYLTTWKYQLKNEIDAGDEEMINYYNDNYVKHGRYLFNEVD